MPWPGFVLRTATCSFCRRGTDLTPASSPSPWPAPNPLLRSDCIGHGERFANLIRRSSGHASSASIGRPCDLRGRCHEADRSSTPSNNSRRRILFVSKTKSPHGPLRMRRPSGGGPRGAGASSETADHIERTMSLTVYDPHESKPSQASSLARRPLPAPPGLLRSESL